MASVLLLTEGLLGRRRRAAAATRRHTCVCITTVMRHEPSTSEGGENANISGTRNPHSERTLQNGLPRRGVNGAGL